MSGTSLSSSVIVLPNSNSSSSPSTPALLSMSGSPTAGLSAPQGSLCLRTDTPSLYMKYGANSVDWIQVFPAPTARVVYDTILSVNLTGGTIDDWPPGTLGQNTLILTSVSNTGTITLTGLAGGADKKTVTIADITSSGNNGLNLEDASAPGNHSQAINQMLTYNSTTIGIPIKGAITLYYDGGVSKWRTIGVCR